MALRHLFDTQMQHDPTIGPVVDGEGRDGTLVGSGDGSVEGPELRGRILWSFYEDVGETDDERYAWLDGALGVWEGRFGQEQGTAAYRASAIEEAA